MFERLRLWWANFCGHGNTQVLKDESERVIAYLPDSVVAELLFEFRFGKFVRSIGEPLKLYQFDYTFSVSCHGAKIMIYPGYVLEVERMTELLVCPRRKFREAVG